MNSKLVWLWLPMILLAFANATFREWVLRKQFNDLQSNQWSTLSLSLLCSLYIWLVFPYLKIEDARQAFKAGLLWTLLTVAFEFFLGFITHKSWREVWQNYQVFDGHLWPLFLLSLFMLPYLVFLLKK